jgi:hypothetical protein
MRYHADHDARAERGCSASCIQSCGCREKHPPRMLRSRQQS